MGNLGDPPGAGTLERIHRIGLTVAVEPGTARQAAAAPLAAGELPDAAVTRAALAEAIERETRLTVVAEDMPHEALLSVVLTAAADRLHVGARVRGSADGANWWGQDWDLPVALYADADFTRSLLARLRFLLDLTSAYSTIRGTTNRDAMLLAVQASDLLLGPAQQDLRRAQEGADALRRALALDPDFARARAGGVAIRAEAAGWRPWTEEEIAAAGLDLDTALAGDPEDPIIHIARALMALLQEDLPQMGRALDEAETYGPSFFWTYLIRADFELQLGFGDMALASALRAVELDPYMLPSWGRVVDVQLWRGDLDGADQALARMVALDVDGFWAGRSRAHILLARGDLDAAESELLALRERWANALWVHQELAAIYLALGDAAAAQAATARLEALLRE
jgi:tetratricopeptide (TPR) repeat protein